MFRHVYLVNVFTYQGAGDNLAPIVLDAQDMTDDEMRDVARRHARESSFLLDVPNGANADFQLRFWVPEHEMEMCGHATVGTAWLLYHLNLVTKKELKFLTKSGIVTTRKVKNGEIRIAVSQPPGKVQSVNSDTGIQEINSVLGFAADTSDSLVRNACTSRMKTAIRLPDAAILNNLAPDFARVKAVCDQVGSTGLYPYSVSHKGNGRVVVEARQFPKASGYPEDAATGIAASALAYVLAAEGILDESESLIVQQGRAMGYLSQIHVQLEGQCCWVSGQCTLASKSIDQ